MSSRSHFNKRSTLSPEQRLNRNFLVALYAKDTDGISAALSQGADIEVRDNNRETGLHWASKEGHEEIVSFLLEKGADPNSTAYGDITPLHLAVDNNHTGTAARLITAGANVNATNWLGLTPLHYAASNNGTETATLLSDSGADLDARDKEGRKPIDYAHKGEQVTALLEKAHSAQNASSVSGGEPVNLQAKQAPISRKTVLAMG